MQRHLFSVVTFALIASTGHAAEDATPVPHKAAESNRSSKGRPLTSGIATQYIEPSVRPQDDFFQYLNGKWLTTTEIPADKPYLDPFVELSEASLVQLRGIIEKAAAATAKGGSEATTDPDMRRIGDFYASFMDEEHLEQLGVSPLKVELERIAALKDKGELPALLARLEKAGVPVPFDLSISLDSKDATEYVATVSQSGLGLPSRDYYLKSDDQRLAAIKAKYQAHIEKMLAMVGYIDAAAGAQAVIDFETGIAEAQWSPVALRDPVKAYNKIALAELSGIAPGFDWRGWQDAIGLSGKTTYVIVSQPTYLKACAGIANAAPLDTWKAYLTMRVLASYSRYLSKAFVDENFEFFNKTVYGTDENQPRWKRGVDVIESSQGDALGKLYVAEYFPAERKARVQAMVQNLLMAYRESIENLDWMSATTKKEALTKLDKFTPKIGYPEKWKDYAALVVKRDDLVGNVRRARELDFDRELNRLGKPVDREEWGATPQTVNAYYILDRNEIVFPAVILQPPFFDARADDAVNYGGIGAVIGHEISHGFDDQGSQYDGDGNLRDWWTPEDSMKFKAKARLLVERYNAFEPLKGYHVNGQLTLGENIADNSGLAIAYKAYRISLNGKKAPTIDGLTGDQRFFMGFGQLWRQKLRDNMLLMVLQRDPHSPGEARTNGVLSNHPAFYEAFGVKPGDRMYLPPKDRVSIW
jgi:predicted metalloendopeptidase